MLDSLLSSSDGSNIELILRISLFYVVLLWVSILIWAVRDALNRSDSLFFHTFTILINLIPPPLGVVLYLIVRPGKTRAERYYEEMEHQILAESAEEEITHCPKCESQANKNHLFCHNCGKKLKTKCVKCKNPFSIEWVHCPQCGKKRPVKKEKIDEENKEETGE